MGWGNTRKYKDFKDTIESSFDPYIKKFTDEQRKS